MKKTLSVLLTIAMLLSLSVCAFAAEDVQEQQPVEQQPVEQQPVEQQPVEQQPVEQQPASLSEGGAGGSELSGSNIDFSAAGTVALPITPPAAEEDLPKDGLQAALDKTDAGGTVIIPMLDENAVNRDFGGAVLDEDDKNTVIEVNGNAIISDPSVGSTGTVTQGLQLLKESDSVTIKSVSEGAEITFDGDSDGTGSDTGNKALKMGIQNYTDLTLENVTIDGTDLSNHKGSNLEYDPNYTNYVVSNNSGSLTVTNGASILAAEGDVAFDLYIDGKYYEDDVPQITITENAGTIEGTVEIGGRDLSSVTDEEAPALNIEGGTFNNFALIIQQSVVDQFKNVINVTGGTFSFDDKATAGDGYIVVKDAKGLSAYIPSGSEIVKNADGSYAVKAIVVDESKPSAPPTTVYIPVEYYAPAASTSAVVNAPAGNADVVVNGETVSVALNDTVVSARVAPVALADNAPAEVKVVVSHSALSGNVFEAIEMVQNLASTLVVKDVEGVHLDASQYEVIFDGYDTIQLKLSPELLAELGSGTHVLTVVLGGGYEIQVTVVIA